MKSGALQTNMAHCRQWKLALVGCSKGAWNRTWIEEAKKVVVGNLICRQALAMMDKEVARKLDDLVS